MTGCPPLRYHDGDTVGLLGQPFGCTSGEQPAVGYDHTMRCPGCAARMISRALGDPSSLTFNGVAGRRMSRVESVRMLLDPLSPMAVVFERELVRRGIA